MSKIFISMIIYFLLRYFFSDFFQGKFRTFNSFITEAPILMKPVQRFAEQVNRLVSISKGPLS